jgi:hypothetical protein
MADYAGGVSRRLLVMGLPAVLALAGCGASSAPASSTHAGASATTRATATTAPPAASSTAARTATTPGPSTTPGAGYGGSSTSTTGARRAAGGSQRVRLPATFRVEHGGALSPPSVSSPAFLAIELTVASADGRRHRIVLATPKPHRLAVPAGGRASVLVAGLRAGHYVIDVDGAPRGALDVGGEPGP